MIVFRLLRGKPDLGTHFGLATLAVMTRYFFDAVDGFTTIDDDGEELPDIGAARIVGSQVAAELISQRLDDIWSGKPLNVVIRTAESVVGTITVSASEESGEPPAPE